MKISNLFGKYTHYNTIIHRLDARFKVFALILLMVICFLPYGLSGPSDHYANQFLVLGIIGFIILLLMIITRIKVSDLFKSLAGLWFMVIFLLIIMVFIPNSNYYHVIYTFSNGYTIYYDGLLQCAQIIFRIILMLCLTMILTSSTSPIDITYAFEWYLTPLHLFKVPTQIFSMILSLALRMIPTILEEANRIKKAQISRGVEYNRGLLTSKIKSTTTLIIPLLISCFSKSNDMSYAMYARGYDPYKKRSQYKILKFKLVDLFSLILLLLISAFFIFLSIYIGINGYSIFKELFNLEGTW